MDAVTSTIGNRIGNDAARSRRTAPDVENSRRERRVTARSVYKIDPRRPTKHRGISQFLGQVLSQREMVTSWG